MIKKLTFSNRVHMPRFSVGAGFVVTCFVIVWQGYFILKPLAPGLFAGNQNTPGTVKGVTAQKDASPSATCNADVSELSQPSDATHLVIPAISLGLPIESQPLENGTWTVDEGVANYAEGTSPFDGKIGNSVLYGHNKVNAFKNLSLLKKGDSVFVQGSVYQFEYEVVSISTTIPTQLDVLKVHGDKELTLLTCNGIFNEKRLIVKTQLRRIIRTNC